MFDSILGVLGNPGLVDDYQKMAEYYLESAQTLHTIGSDEALNNPKDPDLWNSKLLIGFFLIRHALELALKSLAKKLGIKKNFSHNLQEIWNLIDNEFTDEKYFYSKVMKEKIDGALKILKEYNVLTDEEFFRYPIKKNGEKFMDLRCIEGYKFRLIIDGVLLALDPVFLNCSE